MKRAFILVIDSLGIGGSKDANKYNDYGSNTLGHIIEYCKLGKANIRRYGKLKIPNMFNLGLGEILIKSDNNIKINIDKKNNIYGGYAYASEISSGKDTISGHWEISGVPVLFKWGYFINIKHSLPSILLNKIIKETNIKGFLGNCHSSGTLILKKFGEQHVYNNKPIIYTSLDSVVQVACHEKFFGLNNLYNLCKIIRKILINDGYNIARVIARPFIGNKKNEFIRTVNRCDFSMLPPSKTILQKLIEEKNGNVIGIGKISDIFSNIGITKSIKSFGLNNLFNSTINEINKAENNTIIFTNFVDFDSLYGHRRDISGYARELELFDFRLPEILNIMKQNDILIITADHGCDPTWVGSDHTRENIPILIYTKNIIPGFYGHRLTFSDIGQTLANYFNISPMKYGIKII